MSGAAWVDILVIGIALLAAASGYRQGAVSSAMAFIGVLLGAAAGVLLAPHLIRNIEDQRWRLVAGVLLLVALVIVGEISGMVLGRAARSGIRTLSVRRVDSVVGSLLQAVAVLLAAWVLATPISTSAQPEIASAVRESRVIEEINSIAPQWMQRLPREFWDMFDSSGLKEAIGPFGRTPITSVEPPNQDLLDQPIVDQVRPSVVKIEGIAPSCNQALEGSGFVVSPERVMTNAHVVAGTTTLHVVASDDQLDATVVYFDPATDIAVLDVPGLQAPAMRFADKLAKTGEDAVALGYPEAGPFNASAERIREVIQLRGPGIYPNTSVTREVYTVRGSIRQGNSGGPLINSRGEVLGVVFGAAEDPASETGFVLTADQVKPGLAESERLSTAVDTQSCVHS
ncbi:MAG: serine protease [Gordonia sp.]|uniref:MarP family serine protease n=1 Tax=Gordonia rubripertincta TaxID=36822 RepID=A0ABT4MWW8_GORRU|nr:MULTISPECIES: MarP family serine protease [Mycobacteriales]MBA4023245.1 serine protease [Gordonia sp. (in: high G+C Gram-positive bacteria)]MCZ4551502.1 MarP family serine protease [Gordonia rubripertincta]OZG26197.1 acid resistance periplasmic serine protease MarP [Williamsia sp. 1138]